MEITETPLLVAEEKKAEVPLVAEEAKEIEAPSVDEEVKKTEPPLQPEESKPFRESLPIVKEVEKVEKKEAPVVKDKERVSTHQGIKALLRLLGRLSSIILSCLALIFAFKAFRLAKESYHLSFAPVVVARRRNSCV